MQTVHLRVCSLTRQPISQDLWSDRGGWGREGMRGGWRIEPGYSEDSKISQRNERSSPYPLSSNRVAEHVDLQSSSAFRDIPWPLFALVSSCQRRATANRRRTRIRTVVPDMCSLQGLKHLREALVYPFRPIGRSRYWAGFLFQDDLLVSKYRIGNCSA